MKLLNLTISTKCLLLQSISLTYKEVILREFTEEITTYMHPRSPQNISETELFLSASLSKMQNGNELVVVILDKDSQEFLGCSGIHKLNSKHPELGIWLKKSAHGNGYGLETITALKEWAESKYLIYPVDRANIRSCKIPESLGGQIYREYEQINLSGKILYLVEYRILRKHL
jgi:RimJ/RimL family protein N-acetyltransferase